MLFKPIDGLLQTFIQTHFIVPTRLCPQLFGVQEVGLIFSWTFINQLNNFVKTLFFCQTFVNTLSKLSQNIVKILSKLCRFQNFAKTLSKLCQHFVKLLPNLYSSRIVRNICQNFVKTLFAVSTLSKLCQNCVKALSKLCRFQDFVKTLSKL